MSVLHKIFLQTPTYSGVQSDRFPLTKRSFIGRSSCIKSSLVFVSMQQYRALQKSCRFIDVLFAITLAICQANYRPRLVNGSRFGQ